MRRHDNGFDNVAPGVLCHRFPTGATNFSHCPALADIIHVDTQPRQLDLIVDSDGTLRDGNEAPSAAGQSGDRPWIGIHFQCCGVYTRVYRQRDATSYDGRCPKCAAKVSLRVGPDGVASRVFTARPV